MPRLLILGRGRMGQLVEGLAPDYGFEVTAALDGASNREARGLTAERCHGVDVAIDFSRADAVPASIRALASHGVAIVEGTTGWRTHEPELRLVVEQAGVGAVVAPNFSLGANLLEFLAGQLASKLRGQRAYGAWIHELHHARKRDAPSGTALGLASALAAADPERQVDISSTRAGAIPGTHTLGFDGPAETLTLTHTVRDRATFAHGALEAARWIIGRRGWYGMRDVLGL